MTEQYSQIEKIDKELPFSYIIFYHINETMKLMRELKVDEFSIAVDGLECLMWSKKTKKYEEEIDKLNKEHEEKEREMKKTDTDYDQRVKMNLLKKSQEKLKLLINLIEGSGMLPLKEIEAIIE